MRRPVLALAFALGALALGAAGCGSGETAQPKPVTVEGTLPTPTTEAEVKGNPEGGKTVFANAGCGGCHTLKAAGSSGNVGPNLDDSKPALDKILDRVTNGKSPMPAFKDSLTKQQIADVAAFVFQSTHS